MREAGAAYRIADIAKDDRPRERLLSQGAEALSRAELLAILLRVGTERENAIELAQHILKDFNGLAGVQRATIPELTAVHGVGEAKACQIKAAIELGRRLARDLPDDRPLISSPQSVADLVMYDMAALLQENLWVILLDMKNRLMAIEKLYVGSLNSSTVRIGELFRGAIQRSAASVILVHNHPSGDPTPSPEDIAMTRAAIQAGKLLDIAVLDHLVIGQGKFTSIKDNQGSLFPG
jgi:DNA repair protein RadC